MERYGREYMILTLWRREVWILGRAGYPHFYYLYKKIRELGMLLEAAIAVIEQC